MIEATRGSFSVPGTKRVTVVFCVAETVAVCATETVAKARPTRLTDAGRIVLLSAWFEYCCECLIQIK
jgi:hypothetical protein